VSQKKPSPKKRTGANRGGQPRGGQPRRGNDRRGGGRPAGPAGVDETVSELAGPLRKVLERLPETQRKVLELRMGLVDGHPHDLADTARTLGLSLSEARDIEKRAFEHIREAIPLQQLQRFLKN
jgi:DNA-directed RNA polymerase specialized sigma24 family protein